MPHAMRQAERFVQTLKRSLKASKNDGRSLSHHLAEFLLSYCTTPHATTHSTPDELFLKHSLWTRFDLLRSPTKGSVKYKQTEQKQHHDWRSKSWCLLPGSLVMISNYDGDAEWIPGSVLKKLGPVTYSVDIGDKQMVKQHVDQLRQNVHDSCEPTSNSIDDYYYWHEPVTPVQDVDPVPQIPPRPLEEERHYP